LTGEIERDPSGVPRGGRRCARPCRRGAGRRAAGEDEAAQAAAARFEPIDQLLEPEDVVVVDHRLGDARRELVGGGRRAGAEREQIALKSRPSSGSSGGRAVTRGRGRARRELVDLAVGVDPRVVLRARSPLNSDVSPVSPVRV
jgi:hypothetical protein